MGIHGADFGTGGGVAPAEGQAGGGGADFPANFVICFFLDFDLLALGFVDFFFNAGDFLLLLTFFSNSCLSIPKTLPSILDVLPWGLEKVLRPGRTSCLGGEPYALPPSDASSSSSSSSLSDALDFAR